MEVGKGSFWDNLKSEKESDRSMLYRYEMGGIVVYDSSARISDEDFLDNSPPKTKIVDPLVRRELDSANEFGKKY